jgi:cell division protein FtsB
MSSKTAVKTDALATTGYVLALMLVALRWGNLRIERLQQFNRELSAKNDELRREVEKLKKNSR